jgi:hypothetical protein
MPPAQSSVSQSPALAPSEDFELGPKPGDADTDADSLVRRRLTRLPALEQVSGPGAPRHCPLESERTTLGRGDDVDIRVESSGVSGRHLLLLRQGAEVLVEDLESRNGTYLNGLRVSRAVLKEGDSIMAGDAIFLFHEGD